MWTDRAADVRERPAGAEHVMAELAMSYPPQELAAVAYSLYEKFQPDSPEGVEGWGAKGILDLVAVRHAGRA